MRRREEDRIIELAYGELPECDAARLEQQLSADPNAARAVSQFRKLKTDMALLNNIPEHQISTERIREAILRGGLKQKRSGWAWALVPAFAAAASAVLWISKTPTAKTIPEVEISQPQTIVAFEPTPVRENVFHPEVELTDMTHAVRSTYSYGSGTPGDGSVKHSEKRRHESIVPQELNSGMVALSSTDQTGDAVVPTLDASSTDQPVAQPTDGQAAAPSSDDASASAPGDAQKIIVVHDSQDGSTGAQQATEVDPTSNVVVGG